MLQQLDFTKKIKKEEYKQEMAVLDQKLGFLQRECRKRGIPVLIAVEGFSAAGKGTLISRLIEPLDPRGFKVYTTQTETEEESYYPFLWRFWNKMPAKGQITILDRSWYRILLHERFDGKTGEEEAKNAAKDINAFEKLLTDDHLVLIKLFLAVSQKEQEKRLLHLKDSQETAWRVTSDDWNRCKHYKDYAQTARSAIKATDSNAAPWTVIEADDRRYAAVTAASAIVRQLEQAIAKSDHQAEPAAAEKTVSRTGASGSDSILQTVDLSLSLEKEEYRRRLKALQKRLYVLHNKIYRNRIPVILAFEGWDAAGKGGAIKRLTRALDPRGYAVHPFSAPNDLEKSHHYLWRFWTALPKAGHIAVFDRTWYGRVLVERIEGFASEEEWKRAYQEINDMERNWANSNAVIVKFWLHIDQDEQERRFRRREENPDKQWKITEEDWRNRSKWDAYLTAADDMLRCTSAPYAPWVVVEANDKHYARIKVLETVVNALENALKY